VVLVLIILAEVALLLKQLRVMEVWAGQQAEL
jgi:hypothetical protein